MEFKQIRWVLSSRKDLRDFPDEARYEGGIQLWLIQNGQQPSDWKPVPLISPGVCEIRIHAPHEHRIIYVDKFAEAIYVLHCFQKKTRRITLRDIEHARAAYREIQKQRSSDRRI